METGCINGKLRVDNADDIGNSDGICNNNADGDDLVGYMHSYQDIADNNKTIVKGHNGRMPIIL